MKQTFKLLTLLFLVNINYGQSKNIDLFNIQAKEISFSNIDNGFYLLESKDIEIHSFCKAARVTLIKTLSKGFYIINVDSKSIINTDSVLLYSIDDSWKLSNTIKPLLNKRAFKRKFLKVNLRTLNSKLFKEQWLSISSRSKILQKNKQHIILELPGSDFDMLVSNNLVTAISIYSIPKTEADVLNHDLTVNKVNVVNERYPNLNGESITVSIKEQLFNVDDIDFRERYFLTGIENEDLAQHASTVGTIIAGAGNSSIRGRGVANATTITSSDFLQILPDDDAIFTTNAISVQNHSYGTIIESEYGIEANAYDINTNTNKSLIHVFSSGNRGDNTPESGVYSGIPNFSNQTGNFKAAKNIITVGAVNRFNEIDPRSSRGPAYDGRVKPELVAYAPGGTSDAAALVSGVSTILQEAYLNVNNELPPSSLIKAALIAGAKDVGAPGIDFQSGYGNLNAEESVIIITNNQYFVNVIDSNTSIDFNITVPPNTNILKVALTWNDPAANPGDAIALVNDLDLKIIDPSTNIILPWVLNSSPSVEALNESPQRQEDHINTVEYITIENPVAGDYIVSISAGNLSTMNQEISIAYNFNLQNRFEWTHPTSQSPLLTNADNVIRWNSTKATTNGLLEINFNNEGWTTINTNTVLNDGLLSYFTATMNGTAQFRMTIDGEQYTSELFAISPELFPTVLFDCDDEFLLDWEDVPNATGYTVNFLGDRYFEIAETVTESSVLLNKADFETSYFSIKPIFDSINGLPGLALNLDLQRINCYYINFLAFINTVDIINTELNLSTDLNVNSVTIQRTLPDGTLNNLETFNAPFNDLQLTVSDNDPARTTNTYSGIITLNDGTEISTESVDITLPDDDTVILFPNPVLQGDELVILSSGRNTPYEIVDMSGRVIIRGILEFTNSGVNANFKPGIYILRTLEDNNTRLTQKFIVN